MNPAEKLRQLLGRVGLLRAQLSKIMETIHECRSHFKVLHRHPPDKIGQFMANAQKHFAELLKAGNFISTAIENIPKGDKDSFDNYLDDWVVSQTRDRLEGIQNYLEELKQQPTKELTINPKVLEKGFLLVEDAIKILN